MWGSPQAIADAEWDAAAQAPFRLIEGGGDERDLSFFFPQQNSIPLQSTNSLFYISSYPSVSEAVFLCCPGIIPLRNSYTSSRYSQALSSPFTSIFARKHSFD